MILHNFIWISGILFSTTWGPVKCWVFKTIHIHCISTRKHRIHLRQPVAVAIGYRAGQASAEHPDPLQWGSHEVPRLARLHLAFSKIQKLVQLLPSKYEPTNIWIQVPSQEVFGLWFGGLSTLSESVWIQRVWYPIIFTIMNQLI